MRGLIAITIFVFTGAFALAQNEISPEQFIPQFKHGFIYQIKTKIGTAYNGFVVAESKEFVNLENRKTKQIYEIRKSEIEKKSS